MTLSSFWVQLLHISLFIIKERYCSNFIVLQSNFHILIDVGIARDREDSKWKTKEASVDTETFPVATFCACRHKAS